LEICSRILSLCSALTIIPTLQTDSVELYHLSRKWISYKNLIHNIKYEPHIDLKLSFEEKVHIHYIEGNTKEKNMTPFITMSGVFNFQN
jgi:hypothetical protein